ncbi:MAG: DUF4843 domain-containing protein [Salinibacter sp.]
MKRPISVVLGVLLLATTVGACDMFETRDRTFSDDPKVEFAPLSEGVDEADLDDRMAEDTTITTDVQLIGPQRDSDLTVDFVVDDSSTAEEGVHYSLPSTSTTIPANSSTAEVSVTVLNNDQNDGDTNYELFLTLQDGDEIEAAENLKTYTLTILGNDE